MIPPTQGAQIRSVVDVPGSVAYLPAVQVVVMGAHVAFPVESTKVPAAHGAQVVFLVELAKVPSAHGAHVLDVLLTARRDVPMGQAAHSRSAVAVGDAVWNCPGAQVAVGAQVVFFMVVPWSLMYSSAVQVAICAQVRSAVLEGAAAWYCTSGVQVLHGLHAFWPGPA